MIEDNIGMIECADCVMSAKAPECKESVAMHTVYFGLFEQNWHALDSRLRVLPVGSTVNIKRIRHLETWFTSLCAQDNQNNRSARFSGRDN
jgi:hypothetical protein